MEGRFLQGIVLIGLLFACSSPKEAPFPIDQNLFENGDLIYRRGNGVFSKYFSQVSDSIQTYSHVGFVHRTKDSIHVIHAEASELTFIGYVRRDPINKWLADVKNWGLYRLDKSDSIKGSVVKVALNYHQKRVPFDMDFSLKDDKEIYCTELIGLCINQGAGEEILSPRTTVLGKRGFSIDDTFLAAEIFFVAGSDD